jgi:hypothetical protein
VPTLPLARREEASIRTARANLQAHALCALGAIAFVGRRLAVDVDARIDVAANEVHANKAAFAAPAAGLALLAAIRQIQIFTDHVQAPTQCDSGRPVAALGADAEIVAGLRF